jgi:hypothetical protein
VVHDRDELTVGDHAKQCDVEVLHPAPGIEIAGIHEVPIADS